MKRIYLLSVMLVASAQAADAGVKSRYEQWKAQHQQKYDTFKTAYLKRYNDFKEKVAARWGDKTELTDKQQYVQYSDDLSKKTVIDFANNEIRIEVLGEAHLDAAEELARLSKQTVAQTLASDPILPVTEASLKTSILTTLAPDVRPEQMQVSESQQSIGTPSTEEKLEPAAPTISTATPEAQPAATPSPSSKTTVEKDATYKRITQLRIGMPQSVMFKRAEPYLATAKRLSGQYQVDTALILAVTNTESSFNPLAQSPIPAFGLMQVVPGSAGRDVNRIFYKKSTAPKAESLFKPDQNMDFGAAYLNVLKTRYLSGITNQTSRLYCVIAAYNTGAGNVASVFHPRGKKSLKEAVNVINTLTPDQVFERLVNELPYEETRKYLKKVDKALAEFRPMAI
ncbi:MAG: murein transglycosylase domain-containing protein [Pseudomonadota bacterium]|uniref:murein transglycosylase domain-containing protein n=1 Tax=Gallaecimonas pentaromativorans TaxID=584787 RepID=UPI00067EFFBF|nr:murein transglycosylase domain-containing protein [Gallaecimonas pentaromativorans]MED5523658.1 murein transglycosylase domain-containing protein [Pseudomonadota bacterium]